MDTGPATAETVDRLLDLGRLAEAEAAARELIGRDPESPEGHFCLAHALAALGRFAEALAASDAVLARTPSDSAAHAQRSRLLLGAGRVSEAITSAHNAVRLDPANPDAYSRLADALFEADRVPELRAVVTDARRQFPDHPDILYKAGLLALASDQTDELARLAEAGRAIDPGDPRFHLLAGLAAARQARERFPEGPERQQRYRDADRLLAEAVRLWPAHPMYRVLRKQNAADSRDDLLTGWLARWAVGMLVLGFILPRVLMGVFVPLWGWLPATVFWWLLGIFFRVCCPEFALVVPARRADVVTVPLTPKEWRKGVGLWAIFLALTAAVLFLPTRLFGR